ncbi:MAG: glycosyltransferase family 4 protein [Armatimonadetes bacterium]|nr:glycosyltransferase family 4 protein [Armatimonadota bacterium]
MKVLLVVHDLSLTGAPRVILDLFEGFGRAIELRVLALRGGPLSSRLSKTDWREISALIGPQPRRPDRKLKLLRQRNSVKSWMANFAPDVVYINSAASLPVLNQDLLPLAPVLFHAHEMGFVLNEYVRPVREQFLSLPAKYVTVSQAAANDLLRLGVDESKVEIINACIPFESWTPKPRKEAHPVVGGAGLPQWRKGVDLWLLAAKEVATRLDGKVKFRWVGYADDYDSWTAKEKSKILGLEKVVEWIPLCENPGDHYQAFDIFLMTSWEDPCPLVVLENMALEKPVIAFPDGGGAAEELGETGVLTSRRNVHEMADKVCELLADPEGAKRLGEAARLRVQEHFTVEKLAPRLLEAVRTTAQSRDRR